MIVGEDSDIEWGGWMPKGFLTEDGYRPWMGEVGWKEHESPKYPPRTFANVKDSDATIRFATDFNSPGERLTRKACIQYRKEYWDINLTNPWSIEETVDWLISHKVEVLNIAGNRESTSPGIYQFTADYLFQVLLKLNKVN